MNPDEIRLFIYGTEIMKKFKCVVLFGIALLLALISCGNSDTSTNSLIVEDTYYTVFFDTAGGNTIDSQSVKEGEKVERPDNPVKKVINLIIG